MGPINIQVDGVDKHDSPDFADAFIASAEHEDGTPLTDSELDALNKDLGLVHEAALDSIH